MKIKKEYGNSCYGNNDIKFKILCEKTINPATPEMCVTKDGLGNHNSFGCKMLKDDCNFSCIIFGGVSYCSEKGAFRHPKCIEAEKRFNSNENR